jgi:hypothetical protein
MTIKPINSERNYRKALEEIENLWDAKPIEPKPSDLAKILGGGAVYRKFSTRKGNSRLR